MKSLLILLFIFFSLNLFSQTVKTKSIFVSGGVYHLNPNFKYGNIGIENPGQRSPFISDGFGIKFYKETQFFYWGYSFSIIQNRHKSSSSFFYQTNSTITKTFVSAPLYFGINAKNFKVELGAGIDYYLYEFVNYSYFSNGTIDETGRDANKHNSIYPWCISFLESSIPLSFHFETEIGSTFFIADKYKTGISLNLRMSEIISLYGRNYSLTGYDINTKKYYYPISFSLSINYFIGENHLNPQKQRIYQKSNQRN